MTWHSGDQVIVRGTAWQVLRTTAFADCAALDLGAMRSPMRRTLLVPFDRPRRAARPSLRVTSRRYWARVVRSLVTSSFPHGGLQFCPAAIHLFPYQLEPALAMLRHGAVRLLVADDVGLGKTIEAGLIVREVAKGDQLSRTLIVVPSSLREQWAQELRSLFELPTVAADAAWLRRALGELPRGVNPWSPPGIYVASIDFVKRPEALRPLEDVRWDLLVVDEAHTATPASDRRAGVHALACRSRRVILLTATPHSGDDQQFEQLCAIGSFRDGPPLVVFSRSRADTRAADRIPRSVVLRVNLTDEERRMHRLLEDYTARIWSESQRLEDSGSQLLATVLRKRALSSARSLALSLRRRLQLLTGVATPPSQLHLPLYDGQEDDPREDDAESALAGRGLENRDDERAMVDAVAEAAENAAERESKLRVLIRLLRRIRQPAIVFSEYRDTAERLRHELLAHGHRVCVLHGGLTSEEKRAAVSVFRAGGAMLVATDAASEGLNLHTACRTVVHFELPWTPSRLHQRCGRVNRIGQARRVHEIALVANDTAEQLVLEPLTKRAARSGAFSRTPIVRQLPESHVAAHILGGTPLPSTGDEEKAPFVQMHLDKEAIEEAQRIAWLRAFPNPASRRRLASSRHRADIPITHSGGRRPRPRDRDRSLIYVVELTLTDANATVCGRELVGLVRRGERVRWARRPAVLRAQVERIVARDDRELTAIIEPMLTARLAAAGTVHATAIAAQRQRHVEIHRGLRSTARALVQAGLFDRRALRAAMEQSRTSEMLEEDALAHLQTLAADGRLEGRFSIRAILCCGDGT